MPRLPWQLLKLLHPALQPKLLNSALGPPTLSLLTSCPCIITLAPGAISGSSHLELQFFPLDLFWTGQPAVWRASHRRAVPCSHGLWPQGPSTMPAIPAHTPSHFLLLPSLSSNPASSPLLRSSPLLPPSSWPELSMPSQPTSLCAHYSVLSGPGGPYSVLWIPSTRPPCSSRALHLCPSFPLLPQ